MCSKVEIEKVIRGANGRAHKQELQDEENRLMWSVGMSRPIPRTERGIRVTLARKIHAGHRKKKNLDGLYEMLRHGKTMSKVSSATSVIKEPNKPEVRVRNSDIAKFGKKHERNTWLKRFRNQNHKRDLFRKDFGSKKIKCSKKQSDDVSVISSDLSCISAASIVARALKMRIPRRNLKHDETFKSRPYLTNIAF